MRLGRRVNRDTAAQLCHVTNSSALWEYSPTADQLMPDNVIVYITGAPVTCFLATTSTSAA